MSAAAGRELQPRQCIDHEGIGPDQAHVADDSGSVFAFEQFAEAFPPARMCASQSM